MDLTHSHDQPQPNGNTSIITRRLLKRESDAEELVVAKSSIDPTQAGQSLSIDPSVTRRITFTSPASPTRQHRRILSMQGVGARQSLENHPISSPRPTYLEDRQNTEEGNTPHSILSDAFIGRNSQFSNLSLAKREEIGGVEYRAIRFFGLIVPLFFVVWQILGWIGLGAYIASKRASVTEVNAENPW